MTSGKLNTPSRTKVVMVHLVGHQAREKDLVMIFSTSQIEEVLQEVEERPIPFAPDYLLGLCPWRSQILPIIDIVKIFKLPLLPIQGKERYIVVRDVVPGSSGTKIMRCIMKISDQIITTDTPESCDPVTTELNELETSFTKGIFEHENEMMIVPDLVSIFCSK